VFPISYNQAMWSHSLKLTHRPGHHQDHIVLRQALKNRYGKGNREPYPNRAKHPYIDARFVENRKSIDITSYLEDKHGRERIVEATTSCELFNQLSIIAAFV
jgi:hypothetical protein